MEAVVTIKTNDEESARRLAEWLADTHGADETLAQALAEEIESWLTADSHAELSVSVEVRSNE
jgi:hypothetical protein